MNFFEQYTSTLSFHVHLLNLLKLNNKTFKNDTKINDDKKIMHTT